MAEMTGVHVEMGVAIKVGNSEIFHPLWSETIAIGGTTNQTAGGDANLANLLAEGVLIFRVKAQAAGAVWVARGSAPDATQAVSTSRSTTRSHLSPTEMRDFTCKVGDKISCAAAT
jgi:hypothetical protein